MKLDQTFIKEICEITIRLDWEASPSHFPTFLTPYPMTQQCLNEAWLDDIMQAAEGVNQNKRKAEALMKRFILEEPLLGIRSLGQDTLDSFLAGVKSFVMLSRAFDPSLSQENLFQAFRNYSVYAVFLMLNDLPQQCHDGILSYSLLYPYTDNFLDEPGRTAAQKQSMNQLIQQKLLNRPHEAPASAEEKKISQLLDRIAKKYPHAQYPLLYQSLLLIYDAQLASMLQLDQNRPYAAEEILSISIYKGSTSVLTDRCLVPLPLTKEELPFYLGLGFFLQLCDDFQDITEDTAAKSRTLFTQASDESERISLLHKLFHYLNNLFTQNRHLFLCNPVCADFLQKNCHMLILSNILSAPQYFSADYLTQAERFFPIRSAYLQRQSRYTRSTLLPMILSI